VGDTGRGRQVDPGCRHDWTCGEPARRRIDPTTAVRSVKLNSVDAGRTMNSQAPGASRPCAWAEVRIDRNRRRIRLRTTADPTARETEKATLGGAGTGPETPAIAVFSGSSGEYTAVIGPLVIRRPRRESSANVARSRMCQIRLIAGHDPADAERAGFVGRPCLPCGAGNRVGEHVADYWAERSSSRMPPQAGMVTHSESSVAAGIGSPRSHHATAQQQRRRDPTDACTLEPVRR
jgi:hypothetical protein